ncbi:MAG: flagellar hook-associated protein FlgK [Brevundimonas sp.]|uniref:flagellar hook-associated protein FlgK n=1 Tax=Brevundimonas sp. TaxID=1871086 RepID=UPI002766D45B|nr:flagellar hook-associated protein FlgK [Brevundimonas sp.]MDP3400026.1 flagellar hook-associated protein FlgK [Brevundimonas sp.]MDZ4110328.1 flagellar hook-associated protein FlgK [Brevundimonas sp.]
MSIASIMNTANSGLTAAQVQLRVVSDNVSNVNTPGYVRKIAEQQTLVSQGMGSGVEVSRIRLATDRFLQAASFNAGADAARQSVRYELYDRMQGLFGDPGGDGGFFAQVDQAFSVFAAAAEDPASSPRRQEALFRAQALFDEGNRISGQIQAVREDADGRIQSAVEQANSLLEQIEALNIEIARSSAVGSDGSGAETAQAALIGQLSELMDVRVSARSVGGVSIRTGAGVLLAGEGHATLEYHRAGTVNAETAFNEIWVTEPRGEKRPLLESITSGEIKGLVDMRDVEAPQAAERLAELLTRVADELNRAHNANSSVPAPTTLTGRNVGQSIETALAGFSGNTAIAVTNAAGQVQARADIAFTAGAITINGTATTPAGFLATLNAELGGAATASFVDGVLSLSATGTNGVVVADDPSNPSRKIGRGFSHFFGLNDLISTDRPAVYQTGLSSTSPHGFTAGETLTLRFAGETGAKIRDVTVAIPAGGTVADLLAALNNPATGAGRFGAFALNAADGTLSFNANTSPAPRLSVLEDRTTQVPSGVSITELFGIGGGVRASRADGFSMRTDIRQSPARLGLAQFDFAAAVGATGLTSGDGRGALALADAGQANATFQSAGDSLGGQISVSRYASELAGDIGGRAALTKTARDSAVALHGEASARQRAHEGVNLDEELVLMTTYQQAFNASARLIQAARELYDTLLGMV